MIVKSAVKTENPVLIKNIEAAALILLMTRRPSFTICGSDAKSEFNNTRLAVFFAASLPDAIAMLTSASLSASTSFTPSPVIATVRPFCFRSLTICCFCFGVTRPKTEYFKMASSISSSVWIVVASIYLSASFNPARAAIAATVTGSSPEITFKSTPCSSK